MATEMQNPSAPSVSTTSHQVFVNDKDRPDSRAQFYTDQIATWQMLDACLEGTSAMRRAGRTYLPKYPQEAADGYEFRLTQSTFLNFFKKTVTGLTGKPFSQPLSIPEDMPDQLEELFDNVDLQGHDIHTVARNAFHTGLAKGMVGLMVDMPTANPDVKTLDDQRKSGARPYISIIAPESIIGAFAEVKDGVDQFTHVRIMETVIEKDGFAEVKKERIRVLEPGTWELYEKDSKGQWHSIDKGTTSLDYIPLVIWYADKEGFMRSRPPLLDLAYLNVQHWQNASDQNNVLAVSRFPILAASGVDPESKLEIGPNTYFALRDPTARMYYVEHTGAAIGAGRQNLEDLKTEMAMMGLQLLMPQTGNITATAKALDAAEANCGLQSMVISFASAFNLAVEYMGDWLDIEEDLPSISINVDFGLSVNDASDIGVLAQARANREISHQAFMTELLRRKILHPDFSIEDDAEQLKEEASELGENGGGNGLPPKKRTGGKPVKGGSGGTDTQSEEASLKEDLPMADQYPATTING